MAGGNDVHFHLSCAAIRVVDSETEESHSFDVPKPFPNPKAPNKQLDAACLAATPPRAINRMIVGSKNEVWARCHTAPWIQQLLRQLSDCDGARCQPRQISS